MCEFHFFFRIDIAPKNYSLFDHANHIILNTDELKFIFSAFNIIIKIYMTRLFMLTIKAFLEEVCRVCRDI